MAIIDLRDDLQAYVTFSNDDGADAWPTEIGVELDGFKWLDGVIDDYDMTAWVGDKTFRQFPEFIAELHRVIGADIEEAESDLDRIVTGIFDRTIEAEPEPDGWEDEADWRYDADR